MSGLPKGFQVRPAAIFCAPTHHLFTSPCTPPPPPITPISPAHISAPPSLLHTSHSHCTHHLTCSPLHLLTWALRAGTCDFTTVTLLSFTAVALTLALPLSRGMSPHRVSCLLLYVLLNLTSLSPLRISSYYCGCHIWRGSCVPPAILCMQHVPLPAQNEG